MSVKPLSKYNRTAKDWYSLYQLCRRLPFVGKLANQIADVSSESALVKTTIAEAEKPELSLPLQKMPFSSILEAHQTPNSFSSGLPLADF